MENDEIDAATERENDEEYRRYIGYIEQALRYDDNWKEHARQILVTLGEDPDELERDSLEEDIAFENEVLSNSSEKLRETILEKRALREAKAAAVEPADPSQK